MIHETLIILSSRFYWDGMREDIRNFFLQCLHCLRFKSSVIPRPLGNTVQGNSPGKVLHFDFLKIQSAKNGWNYVLVIKDSYSNYVRLIGCEAANSYIVADSLVEWMSMFTKPDIFVSDQGSHFKNIVISELTRILQVDHHFVTAYCPWANSSVERVNRDILVVLQSLLSEFRMSKKEWPKILPLIQLVLNHTPSGTLGDIAPIQAFTGQEPFNPLDSVMQYFSEDRFESVERTAKFVIDTFSDLRQSLDVIYKKVMDAKKQRRQRSKKIDSNSRMLV